MTIKQGEVPNAMADELEKARLLFQEAFANPSTTEGFSDWELNAAETFGNIHEYAEHLGIGVAQLLRMLAKSKGSFGLKDGTIFF